jgi:hypothetical protein
MCTGLSIFWCARNSDLTYWSPHFGGEVFAVGAQEAAVEEDGWQEGHWFWAGAAGYARGGCEEAEGGTHFEGVWWGSCGCVGC